MYRFLYGFLFSIFLGIYIEVELLGHVVILFKVLMYCQSSYTILHSTSNVLLGVGHDLLTSLSLFTFMHWRRKWQPTPVFLPGESQGRGSLVGCRLWSCTESDMTEST